MKKSAFRFFFYLIFYLQEDENMFDKEN